MPKTDQGSSQLNLTAQAAPLPADFLHEVRTALLHLYDNAFLQNHPLAAQVAGGEPGDRLTRAQDLRRLLLDCIERLRPQPTAPGDAARPYVVLTYRYVDGLTIEEIEHRLGLSRRQTYREFTKGVEAVAGQIWDLLHSQRSPVNPGADALQDQATTSRRALAEAELVRLSKEVHREPLLLADVIAGICKLLESRLQMRCMILTIDTLDAVSPVLADRTLLRQAFLNLLSYALNVLPDGSALALAAEEVAGTVHLRLRQTMAGAPGDRSAAPARSSEGVAVAVAQSLVAAQNGRLALDGTPGAWSAEMMLPTVQAPTVLIIDDNQDLVELFQRYLAGHRLKVVGANSGAAALASIQQSLPQAIVLDVMMPHQDGWEVLQLLRQTPACATIPIIVCSVLRERDLALALGASDTLIKPVSQSALLDALRRWLGSLHPLD